MVFVLIAWCRVICVIPRKQGNARSGQKTASASTGIQSTEELIKNKKSDCFTGSWHFPLVLRGNLHSPILHLWSQQWIKKIHHLNFPTTTHLRPSASPWGRFLAVLHCLAWWAAPLPSNPCMWVAISFWVQPASQFFGHQPVLDQFRLGGGKILHCYYDKLAQNWLEINHCTCGHGSGRRKYQISAEPRL